MSSLAITDAILFLSAAWLASQLTLPIGHRLALGLLGIAALLGFLKFSGLYPIHTWHRLFSIFGGSAALPMLAVCVFWPQSAVTNRRQYALIFLGVAALLGLAIGGLGQFRIYDQVLGALSMLIMLSLLVKKGDTRRSLGVVFMLAGSLLFLAKVNLPWLQPGDLLHLGMAIGLLLFAPAKEYPRLIAT
jgi:uncharacterized membrane protein YhaH (DUF805 family)